MQEAPNTQTRPGEKDTSDTYPSDCPEWAKNLIDQLKAAEIRLGNIAVDKNWSDHGDLQALMQRCYGENELSADQTDAMFKDICLKLAQSGFSKSKIAEFINSAFTESRMAYCDEREVGDAIGT